MSQSIVKTNRPGTVSGPVAFCEQAVSSLWSRTLKSYDRRCLNKQLNKKFNAARAFQQNSLAPGSQQYKVIYRECCDSIKTHADRWGVSLEKVAVETPALYGLEKLANPEKGGWISVILMALIVALALFLLAAVLGATSGIFHLVSQTVGR